MEQPELGGVGIDAIQVSLTYRWESGYRVRAASRLSGSTVWHEVVSEGLDGAEAHAKVSEYLAWTLGLA